MLKEDLKDQGYDKEEEYFKELERKQLSEYKKKIAEQSSSREKKSEQ